ncbi:MAG TPA: hypothetical protein V6D06_18665 [Trichocoleus sp.]
MADDQNREDLQALLEEVADNPGARAAAISAHPELSDLEAENAVAGEGPNASGSIGSSEAEDHVPSNSEPYASDLPTANTPDPKEANPETNPNAAGSNNLPSED